MMNFASYHKEVVISFYELVSTLGENGKITEPKEITLNDVQVIITGDSMICNGLPTRDEENNLKFVASRVFKLSDIYAYHTTTQYNPEAGLDNKEQLNG